MKFSRPDPAQFEAADTDCARGARQRATGNASKALQAKLR
jgi:hypothetical protein